MDLNTPIYNPLSKDVCERSGELIGLSSESQKEEQSAKEQFKEFLEKVVPEGDKDEITDELRRGFLLMEKRAYVKPCKSRKQLDRRSEKRRNNIPHRGKKRLTSHEKRKLGFHKLDKTNKTFEMFLPMYDMWKSYAVSLLGIDFFVKNGWVGERGDSRTETMQNRLKKIEYVGSFLRVTMSRCSEYVGTTGIVIQETRNTFVLVTPEDKVYNIPKQHSEFSFVLNGVGVSVLGNHLYQRPVDRAKHNLKKHCLWM
ncbi:ribonuclease P/MRP subunit POP4 [Oratosquilla oratoria]|uniref:ribonuclease P/MRP subunit POP4 n=1 Tax=Oratosquilla oratoria TaxID=337810 RepID=UPI003F7667DD